MRRTYPFADPATYTASFATTASVAIQADNLQYVTSASVADTVLEPQSGSPPTKRICRITYEEYLLLLASTNYVENCPQ